MFGGLNTTRARVGFQHTSRYNPYVTYGVGGDRDLGKYHIRWLKYKDGVDTSVVFKIVIDAPAGTIVGGETFQVDFATENGAWNVHWSWTCDTPTSGNTLVTVTLGAGQTEVNFTMTAKVLGKEWAVNRIVTATIQNPSATLEVDRDREVQKLALIPAEDPPKIRISTAATGFSVSAGGSQQLIYTNTLNKAAPLEVPQRAELSGPLAPYCTLTTSPINQNSTSRNNGITCDVDAAVAAGLGVGDGVSVSLDYERSDVAFTETDWNPVNENFEVEDTGGTNLLDPETDWTVGTGSVNGWNAVGATGENSRQTLTNPHGDSAVVWVAENIESAVAFDGGFRSPLPLAVDPTKTYRRSVWLRRQNATEGRVRWTHQIGRPVISPPSSGTDVLLFTDLEFFTQVGEWYLAVSYIHPYNYTGPSTGLSQVYSADGTAVAEVREFTFSSATDVNDFSQMGFYNDPTDNNEEVWFWDPRYDLVDGSEPSITDLLTPPVEYIRNVHADENLWQWSNDLVAGGSETGEDTPIALYPVEMDLPRFPGIPTPAIYDGTKHTGDSWGQGGGRPQAQIWEQDDTSPVLDPVTGNPLKIYGPDQYAEGMPYVRESFSKVFCGGPLTAHQSRPFMRMSFVIEYMQGVDAGRNMEFHRVGIRIREANRNHGAVFRSSVNMPDPLNDARIGKDRNGNSVPVYGPFDGVKFWLWQYGYSMAPQDCGVVADENGHPRLWYWVQMDPNIVYPGPSFTNVPDDVGIFCNPIEYPQWFATNDGTNIRADGATDRTLTIDQIRAQRLGALWHSMMFEMSDTTYNGGPTRFWPKMSHNGWAPLGNASLEDDPQYDTSVSFVLEA